jgi:hypothetical protein
MARRSAGARGKGAAGEFDGRPHAEIANPKLDTTPPSCLDLPCEPSSEDTALATFNWTGQLRPVGFQNGA